MTTSQYLLDKFIKDNFVNGTIKSEFMSKNEILITDFKGVKMTLIIDSKNNISDLETKKIYAYNYK